MSAAEGSMSATKTWDSACASSRCWTTRRTPLWPRSRSPNSSARCSATEERSLSIEASGDQLEDFEGAVAFGGLDAHGGAELGVHQRPADRRLGREPAFGQVGLGRADQGPDDGLAFGLVEHLGGAAEAEEVAVELGDLDHDRVPQPFLEALDPRLHVGLVLFGDVILGVLLQVALLARDLDPRRHLFPGRAFQLGEFGFQLFDSGLGDRLAGLLLGAHPKRVSDRADLVACEVSRRRWR